MFEHTFESIRVGNSYTRTPELLIFVAVFGFFTGTVFAFFGRFFVLIFVPHPEAHLQLLLFFVSLL